MTGSELVFLLALSHASALGAGGYAVHWWHQRNPYREIERRLSVNDFRNKKLNRKHPERPLQ